MIFILLFVIAVFFYLPFYYNVPVLHKNIKSKNSHIRSLDSLRGTAALLVCGGHYLAHLNIEMYFPAHQAVILFFVLSGYVLSLSLDKSKSEFSYRGFMIKRFFRLYPAYYFAIIITTIFVTGISAVDLKYVLNWTFLITDVGNLFSVIKMIDRPQIGHPINSVTWSLTYEMLISIFFPLLFIFFNKIIKNNALIFITILVYITLGYLCFQKCTIVIFSIFYYSTFFVLGMMLSMYIKQLKLLSHIVFFIVGVILFFNNSIFILFDYKIFDIYWLDTCSAIGALFLILGCVYNPLVNRIMLNKVICFYGLISYSFYLIHGPMLYIAFKYLSNQDVWMILLTSFIISSILSYLSYLFIEQPFIRFATRLNNNTEKVII